MSKGMGIHTLWFSNKSPSTKFNKSLTHVGSPMRLTPPTPTRRLVCFNIISINGTGIRHPRLPPLLNGCHQSNPMATKNDLLKDSGIKDTEDSKKKGGREEESEKKLPPPPEKPEPGDCCGSGCVRCVWDVYYEELEAYDKLYKSESSASKPS